jgi:hypothetical protein
MDIKREAKKLAVCVACEQAAKASGNARAVEYYGELVRRLLDGIDRWADMAEAAIAYVEYQTNDGSDAGRDGATYICERGKLWRAFMQARAKAKGASNEST